MSADRTALVAASPTHGGFRHRLKQVTEYGRRLLAALGRPLVSAARTAAQTAGFGWAVLDAAVRPLTWRRPVRAAFLATMREAGVGAVQPTVIAGILIGLAMVYQAMFWLQAAGQTNLLGDVLVLVLVREIAPLLAGLILIGRSGTALLIDLGMLRSGGQLRMLDASGIDPLLLLVVPRAFAFALATFCLAIILLVTALLTGYVAGQAVGAIRLPLYAFIDGLLAAMNARVYVLLFLKTLAIGFVVGIISARAALGSPGRRLDISRPAANGFTGSVLASFAVSGALSLVL